MCNSLFKNEQDILLFDKTLGIMVDDKIALEGIYNSMEKSIPHGGLDLASKDIVNVTLEHILNKYAIDDIGTLSNNVPSVMSLEALKDKIAAFGRGVKAALVAIYNGIVKFLKWIYSSIFDRKKAIKKEEAAQEQFVKVITTAANNPEKFETKTNDSNVEVIILPNLPKITQMVVTSDVTPQDTKKLRVISM